MHNEIQNIQTQKALFFNFKHNAIACTYTCAVHVHLRSLGNVKCDDALSVSFGLGPVLVPGVESTSAAAAVINRPVDLAASRAQGECAWWLMRGEWIDIDVMIGVTPMSVR